MKVSIIVPVFKVETYLRRCIESLVAQDLPKEDYEIILVDDGSPDECPAICDDYASKQNNVKVIHRPNGGLSAARNSGIKIAKGEYVQFVDSDDYLEPNVLRTLVDMMEKEELDVLRFNYQNVNENQEVFEPNKVSKPFVDYRDEVCNGLTFLTDRLGTACYAVQFMLRRSLLSDCLFKEGLLFEDVEWTPKMLVKAERVSSTILIVYNYQFRVGSITQSTTMERRRKVLEDKMRLIDSLQLLMNDVSDTRWYRGMIAQITIGIIADISRYFYNEKKAYLKMIKRKGVYFLYPFHSTSSAKRKIFLANISPMLLCRLLRFNSR